MGLLESLFRVSNGATKEKIPERRTILESGFFWGELDAVSLVAGRGFNQPVVGESFYHDNLRKITDGETRDGVNVSCAVELREGEFDGKPSLEIWIQNERCGSIPKGDLPGLLVEFRAVANSRSKVLAKGRISAGFENADYCVEISVSRPLKARK